MIPLPVITPNSNKQLSDSSSLDIIIRTNNNNNNNLFGFKPFNPNLTASSLIDRSRLRSEEPWRNTSDKNHNRSFSDVLPTRLLLSRSRVTNLAVMILTGICLVSLYLNLRLSIQNTQLISESSSDLSKNSGRSNNLGALPVPDLNNSKLRRLIVVPGHAIYLGGVVRSESDLTSYYHYYDPRNWILEPYQSRWANLSIRTFISHIYRALREASVDHQSLLIYSGGQTRQSSNQTISEASSYLRLSHQLGLISDLGLDPGRITTEEFATDSLTNVLYSICRFKEYTGNYPDRVTVVGQTVKSSRFRELHLRALRYPKASFDYITTVPDESDRIFYKPRSRRTDGIDDIKDRRRDGVEQEEKSFRESVEGERKVYLDFERDLYGCKTVLRRKRIKRNPFRRYIPYSDSCPELSGLLKWCPKNGVDIYPNKLPW